MRDKYFENETFENLHITDNIIRDSEFIDCNFIGCTFERCKLSYCRFNECVFEKCNITEIKSNCSQISFVSFEDCNISGVNWGLFLSQSGFHELFQKLENCKIKYNVFSDFESKRFNFENNDVIASTFADCKIPESSFNGCTLTDTEFFRCDISKTDFRNAIGYKIDILTCNIKKAKFSFPEVNSLLDSLDIIIET